MKRPKEQIDLLKDHILWTSFIDFMNENKLSLKDSGSWEPWWDCFLAGAIADERLQREMSEIV